MNLKPWLGVLAALLAGTALADSGKAVYIRVCASCHDGGLMNAPKLGDKEAWQPRIAQGRAVLLDHADYGYKAMPPHGGNDDLSDRDVEVAVDYMVEQSGGYVDKK